MIDVANTYTGLSPDVRTVILKIHGQVDRGPAREWESFVVSEDDYIDYLAHADIANLMPVTLAAKLRRSHFLFLGYAPEEWPLPRLSAQGLGRAARAATARGPSSRACSRSERALAPPRRRPPRRSALEYVDQLEAAWLRSQSRDRHERA